jgi:hypothetical protein
VRLQHEVDVRLWVADVVDEAVTFERGQGEGARRVKLEIKRAMLLYTKLQRVEIA